MIPDTGTMLKQDFGWKTQPSKTYRVDGDRIRGTVDGVEAVRQTVYCILNTERFEHLIYSWKYGAELGHLVGKPMGLVESKLKKRIREALTQDTRIQSVDAFSFTRDGRRLLVHFTVNTVQGSFEADKEVSL